MKGALFLASIWLLACSAPDSQESGRALMPSEPKVSPVVERGVTTIQAVTPPILLDLPTGEFSHQAVHPSVLVGCRADLGWRYLMMMTPYPWGNYYYENPSLVVSNDNVHWSVPAGLTNPIIAPLNIGNNSDPDLFCDEKTGEILFTNRRAKPDSNVISLYTTKDLLHWSVGKSIILERSHNIISPSLVRGLGRPRMYYVNAGPGGCGSRTIMVEMREVENAEAATLSAYTYGKAVKVDLVQPGFLVWHLVVEWVPAIKLYLATYAAFPDSTPGSHGCLDDELFLATSADGIHFLTYPEPLVSRRNAWHEVASLYRAATHFDEERRVLQVWPSSLDTASQWHIWSGPDFQIDSLLARLERSRQGGGFTSAKYQSLRTLKPELHRIVSKVINIP